MNEDELELLAKFEDWLEHTLGRSGNTINVYHGHLLRLADFLGELGKGLLEAKRADLEEFVGAYAHDLGIALRSRKPLIAAVRKFYTWLKLTERREDNPAQYLLYPTVGRPLPRVLPKIHAEDLMKSCDLKTLVGVRDAALMGFLMGLGLRVSGLESLNLSSLSMHSLDDGRLQMMCKVVEKGKKERILPVPSVTQALLGMYLTHPERQRVSSLAILPDGDAVLFLQVNRGSCPLHEWHGERMRLGARAIQHMLERRGAKAGVPRNLLNPHAMRHFFGTEMAEHEVDLRRIQLLMGHSKLDTTAVYLHTAVRKLTTTMDEASPIQHLDWELAKVIKVLPKPEYKKLEGK